MLLNSLDFFLFLATTGLVAAIVREEHRSVILLGASLFFVGTWGWQAMVALGILTCITFAAGITLAHPLQTGRTALAGSIIVLLIPLLYYKYGSHLLAPFANHENLGAQAFSAAGAMPAGLSFYTFQALAYCVDVFRNHAQVERHFGRLLLYHSWFPKFIAGPIERAAPFLATAHCPRPLQPEGVIDGLVLLGWGLFKKTVIADRLALPVGMVFDNPLDAFGKTVILAVFYYTIQIYCDFSSYTDMARGASEVLGVKLMDNFRYPLFSRSVPEFWRAWHISLTSWFRDYLYIPMGGNRVPLWRWMINIMAVFVLSGIWHGAGWTFVAWGALHGAYCIASRFLAPFRMSLVHLLGLRGGWFHQFLQMVLTFLLVALAWVFFRANTFEDALVILSHIPQGLDLPLRITGGDFTAALTCTLLVLFFGLEALIYLHDCGKVGFWKTVPAIVRTPLYVTGLLFMALFGVGNSQFIYFHF